MSWTDRVPALMELLITREALTEQTEAGTGCCCCCSVAAVMSNSVRPHRRQPTRLPRPWDSPGKNTGVGCHFLLQCMKVRSESEVTQPCPTLSDPMDCSPPGSSVHGTFQARALECGATASPDGQGGLLGGGGVERSHSGPYGGSHAEAEAEACGRKLLCAQGASAPAGPKKAADRPRTALPQGAAWLCPLRGRAPGAGRKPPGNAGRAVALLVHWPVAT